MLTQEQLDIFVNDLEKYKEQAELHEINMYEYMFGVPHPHKKIHMEITHAPRTNN